MASTEKWTVIGIGADFRGDDTFGLMVIDYLREQLVPPKHMLKKCNDISKLIYDFESRRRLILIDAVKDQAQSVGTEVCWQIADSALPTDITKTSSHSIALGDSLAMGKMLGTLPESILFFGVVGKQFGLGSNCSPEVENKVKIVGSKILQILLS